MLCTIMVNRVSHYACFWPLILRNVHNGRSEGIHPIQYKFVIMAVVFYATTCIFYTEETKYMAFACTLSKNI
jgi:hypothetical protein